MAVGIMLAVGFVLVATLTLLPAALGALGPRIDAAAVPFARRQPHRSPCFARWGAAGSSVAVRRRGGGGLDRPRRPGARPADRHAVDRGRPGRCAGAPGLRTRPAADGRRRARCRDDRRARGRGRTGRAHRAGQCRYRRGHPAAAGCRRQPAADDSGLVLLQAVPGVDPSLAAGGRDRGRTARRAPGVGAGRWRPRRISICNRRWTTICRSSSR